MRLFPQSLLTRTVLMIGGLLLASQIAWLMMFSLYEREPRAKQIAQRAAAVVNLTRAALLAAQPDKRHALLSELSQREGIHILPLEADEAEPPPPANRLQALVADGIRRELGEETPIGFSDDQGEGVWIGMNIAQDNYWLILPSPPRPADVPLFWIGWGLAVLLFSLGGGALLARRVNRPLLQAAEAARKIGRGEKAPVLSEAGVQEIAALTRAINQMSAEIAALEANRKLMLAGISHDLRTPMTRLRLALEINVGDPAERQAMVADLVDMEQLSQQFMDFAREDTEEPPIEIDLDALVAEIASIYNRDGCTIAVQGHAGKCRLRPQVMRRALCNLLENALKHGAPPIIVELSHTADEWAVTVIDHGSGLPEAELETIKQPFRRGESARTGASGAGLGLTIAERAARLHEGRLELFNRPGGGLAVKLSLSK